MIKLIVLCGIQCSGKSTYTEQFKNNDDYVIVSSDGLRKQYPNDDNEHIFRKVYQQMNEALHNCKNVILDATNITIKARKQIFANLKESCYKECVIFNTPIEICRKRLVERNNREDSHKVPEDVLEKYYHSFQIPFYEEGWDKIGVFAKLDDKSSFEYTSELLRKAQTFNQNNKHHTQLLGQHMETVGNYLYEHLVEKCEENDVNSDLFRIVVDAGFYHDVGKLFTQTYKENDPNAHYYDHANVGAYELLCKSGCYDVIGGKNIYNTDLTLEWLFYINYHMILHNVETEKAKAKWVKTFGTIKYQMLRMFMEADFYRPETV